MYKSWENFWVFDRIIVPRKLLGVFRDFFEGGDSVLLIALLVALGLILIGSAAVVLFKVFVWLLPILLIIGAVVLVVLFIAAIVALIV